MVKQIWLNLPVKDVSKSAAFFKELGFAPTPYGNSETSAGIMIGDNNFVVMLFKEQVFKSFIESTVADTAVATELLISIDAQSREEVDAWPQKVTAAGGSVFRQPAESQGWMYGCGFTDPDGHRWNVLYMDMEKMPGK
jgi:predicted lactoylglutathione lyase